MSNVKYTIVSRRKVPATITVLGTQKVEHLTNGGKLGICIQTESGGLAWGFGADEAEAVADALRAIAE